MTAPGKSNRDVPLESSIPHGAVPLESILCTEELHRRPSRPPDCGNENRALVKLVGALADSPRTILQRLAEAILDITQSDSAGLSLLTIDGETPDVCGERFYWPAIAGVWNPHVGGRRVISDPAEMCLIKIEPCCSHTSSDVILICCQ